MKQRFEECVVPELLLAVKMEAASRGIKLKITKLNKVYLLVGRATRKGWNQMMEAAVR